MVQVWCSRCKTKPRRVQTGKRVRSKMGASELACPTCPEGKGMAYIVIRDIG